MIDGRFDYHDRIKIQRPGSALMLIQPILWITFIRNPKVSLCEGNISFGFSGEVRVDDFLNKQADSV
jgi:hypothetical protein